MYDVSKLPAVQALLKPADRTEDAAGRQVATEHARAPAANGGQVSAGRPPATQGTTR